MIGYYPNVLRENLFLKQQKLRGRKNQEVISTQDSLGQTEEANPEDEQKVLETQEKEFSRSLDLTSRTEKTISQNSVTSSFIQSVVVAGSEDDGYNIYSTSHDHGSRSTGNHSDQGAEQSRMFLVSQSYDHNIGNPGLLQHRKDVEAASKSFSNSARNEKRIRKSVFENKPKTLHKRNKSKGQTEPQCNCGKYHSHKLGNQDFTVSIQSAVSWVETRISFPGREQVVANHVTVANVFWKSHLAFCDFKHGDKKVAFQSLWPSADVIEMVLKEGIEDTGLRTALWELCILSLTSGPLSLLKSILDLKFISKYRLHVLILTF